MDALDSTVKNARNAMNKTKDLLSKKGRSSKLGKRSIGHIDPGAASSFVIINSIYQTLKNSS
jgi:dihydroxyacetone kinase-like protein